MKRLFAAVAVACALALAGCQTTQTSATGWSQIAAGVGQVIGSTKADGQVAKASAQLIKYCGQIELAAFAVDMFAPEKIQRATADARIVFATVCAKPPQSVVEALVSAAAAYAAIEAARAGR
ncbi:hypothetical protein [Bosea sp. 2RAB26]|uniref:hypothetical protein n=1 Tax=Bosea sp. 2RAB26 TaxID=3237476 RepID=UPI003F8ED813